MRILLAFMVFFLFSPREGRANEIILDAEVMDYFSGLAAPLHASMPVAARSRILLVNGPDINAFADAEGYINLFSGLLLKSTNGSEVQGVIAHEMGHVEAQHITRAQADMQDARLGALATAVVGIGAAVAGAPQLGTALVLGGEAGALSHLLAHSRVQEQEADRRAVEALHRANISAEGMVEMFDILQKDGRFLTETPPPYLSTHPLPRDRFENLSQIVGQENNRYPSVLSKDTSFERIKAKVFAMTRPPMETLRTYGGSSYFSSRYARAIALMRQGKLGDARALVDGLLKESPNDLYLREFSAQLYVENGKLGDAANLLKKLVDEKPQEPLFRYQLAEVMRNLGDAQGALPHYKRLTREWQDWPSPWKGLGLCYGMQGKLASSQLALAQASVYEFDLKNAEQHLVTARHYMKSSASSDEKIWLDELEAAVKAK